MGIDPSKINSLRVGFGKGFSSFLSSFTLELGQTNLFERSNF